MICFTNTPNGLYILVIYYLNICKHGLYGYITITDNCSCSSITFSHILTYTVRYQTVYKFNLKVAGAALFDQLIQHIVCLRRYFYITDWTKKGLAICRAYNTIYRSRSKTKHLTGKKEEISERAKQKQSLFQDGQTCIRFHMSREYRNDECNVTQWKERQNNNIRWVTTHSGKTGGLG